MAGYGYAEARNQDPYHALQRFPRGAAGSGGQTESGIRRIIIHNQHIVILRLFYGKVGAGVLQLRRKGNGTVASDGIKITSQIVCEIHRDLPGL